MIICYDESDPISALAGMLCLQRRAYQFMVVGLYCMYMWKLKVAMVFYLSACFKCLDSVIRHVYMSSTIVCRCITGSMTLDQTS